MKESPIDQAINRFNNLKYPWSNYDESKKKEIVSFYFNVALYEYDKAKETFSVMKKKIIIRNPTYVSIINNMVYNFTLFLLTYSELKGSWNNFNKEIKAISLLLWDSGMGHISYKLFVPVLQNTEWRQKYLSSSKKKFVNDEYHRREPNTAIPCDICGRLIINANITKHHKKCQKNYF